jgi:putative CocE/NonD family hydrolase
MTATPLQRAGSAPRTPLMRLGDRAFGRLLRLPPATTDYTVTRGLRVPMRDGVELLTDHYAPTTSSPAGTLLVRAPYGRGMPGSLMNCRVYAERGYHVVLQSTRGTFGSGGLLEPGRREVEDGSDTVAWLREQPWFTGRFGTLGPSYLGFTQWALLVDPPPEMTAAVISVGPHDLSWAAWRTGSFALSDFLSWSHLVTKQERGGFLADLARQQTAQRRMRAVLKALPPRDAGRAMLGDGAPWYEDWLDNHDVTADYWRPVNLTVALEKARIPVLIFTGWQDVFLDQSLHQYRRLRDRGVDVALTVGPWAHMDVGGRGSGMLIGETLDWFGEHLTGTTASRRASPVRICVTGDTQWRDLPDWPPAFGEKVLYLRPGAALGDEPPPADAAPSRFTFDPADPTPTIGGRFLSVVAGYRDDSRLADRADVLTFTTSPLTEALDVTGTPVIELAHSTDTGFADVSVRISEVDADGRSRNVSDGYVRLDGESPSPLRITLDPIAHRFCVGSRIRLLVAGGSHPRFARNLGTGEPVATGSRFTTSTHVLAHGQGGTSRLILPVATGAP